MNEERYRAGAELPLTDDGNALRVTHYLGDRLRYVKQRDQWYNWDGRRWNRATDADMIKVGRSVAHYIDQETATLLDEDARRAHRKHATAAHAEARIRSMVSLARGDSMMWIDEDDLDARPYLVNFANGTLDVRTRELKQHDPDDLLTGLVRHEYDPTADAPQFRKLVARTFQDANRDGDTVDYVRKALGYGALVGRNVEQKIFFIVGDPNCGKSKVLEIVAEVVGPDHAHKSKTDLISRKSGGHHDSERYSLVGKRFVTISETSSLFNLDESTVKELTADRRVTARQLHRGVELNPLVTWTIFLTSNDFPNVLEWDDAIKRRVVAIPAGPRLADHEVIKDLDERVLRDEASGVLAWLVAGAHAWYANWQAAQRLDGVDPTGLAPPASIELFTETYAQSQDHFSTFIAECVVLDEHCSLAAERDRACRTPRKDVHDAFRRWRGPGEVSNRNRLYARVGKLSGVTHDARYFTGLCLRDPELATLAARVSL